MKEMSNEKLFGEKEKSKEERKEKERVNEIEIHRYTHPSWWGIKQADYITCRRVPPL